MSWKQTVTARVLETYIQLIYKNVTRLPTGLVNVKCLVYSLITGLNSPSFAFMVEV